MLSAVVHFLYPHRRDWGRAHFANDEDDCKMLLHFIWCRSILFGVDEQILGIVGSCSLHWKKSQLSCAGHGICWFHSRLTVVHSQLYQWSWWHFSWNIFLKEKNISHRKAGCQRSENVQREDLGQKRKIRCHGKQKKSCSLSRNYTEPDEKCDEEEVAERNCCVLTMADPCYHPCFPI